MEEKLLLTEEKSNIITITLNRSKVMNSLNMSMLYALKDEIDKLILRKDIRVVIIIGSGEKAFCAGADLKERATLNDIQVKKFILTIRNLFSAIENLNKPVIAGVNGIALGGGTELALACDIRIASENASMGLTETRLGIIPGAGGTQRLPRIVGRGKAKELIFTGRRISAKEALNIGLVNEVVSLEKLQLRCFEMAEEICETAPIAISQAKYAINYGMETDINTGLAIESNAYWLTIPTKDRVEALTAFKEKRKPVFKGE